MVLATMIAVGAWSLLSVLPAYTEYSETRVRLHEVEGDLLLAQKEYETLQLEITQLRDDHRAIERVAREKFGWCRDGDEVYEFDD
jgi:hypothetical protein